MTSKTISIVIPVYNEERILDALHARLEKIAQSEKGYAFEYVFVNDGSQDGTFEKLLELSARDPRVVVLDLARNFGHHPALTAGLDHASGDAVVLMDADFEDDPDDVRKFIAAWEQGSEVVYAVRGNRRVGVLKDLAFKAFHALNSRLEHHMPQAGVFSLMDRRVVSAFRRLPERKRYIPGLRAWAGYRQKGILLDRGERYDGSPRISTLRLVRLALDNWVSFSKMPLKLAGMAGAFFSMAGFLAIAFIVVYQLLLGFKVSGWSSLIVTVIFASGIQLICLWILGEYIGQILDETKGRPVYLLRSKTREGAKTPGEKS